MILLLVKGKSSLNTFISVITQIEPLLTIFQWQQNLDKKLPLWVQPVLEKRRWLIYLWSSMKRIQVKF